MIIAGHNYARHFGSLRSLMGGETVYFTDMSGETTEYVVDDVSIVGPDGLDSLEEGEWNLVPYTCTYGGRNRVMVRCSENSELQGGA